MQKLAKRLLARLLARRGLEMVAIAPRLPDFFIAEDMVLAAEREGLSVSDYVEELQGVRGEAQHVVDEMASCGAFEAPNPVVLEIGTGTGRYVGKVLAKCTPSRYESYEVLRDWAEWLRSTYPVVSHEADGASLRQTPSNSVDILHSHGVFVYLPFLACYRYWREMWRVTKPGGIVVFDIFSEDCMDEATVEEWLKPTAVVHPPDYPCFLSKNYVASLFARHGFESVGTFMSRLGEGRSEYLVFVRGKAAT